MIAADPRNIQHCYLIYIIQFDIHVRNRANSSSKHLSFNSLIPEVLSLLPLLLEGHWGGIDNISSVAQITEYHEKFLSRHQEYSNTIYSLLQYSTIWSQWSAIPLLIQCIFGYYDSDQWIRYQIHFWWLEVHYPGYRNIKLNLYCFGHHIGQKMQAIHLEVICRYLGAYSSSCTAVVQYLYWSISL